MNVAARLVEKASPNEILVSEPTQAGLDTERISTRTKKTFRWTRVKGVPEDLRLTATTVGCISTEEPSPKGYAHDANDDRVRHRGDRH